MKTMERDPDPDLDLEVRQDQKRRNSLCQAPLCLCVSPCDAWGHAHSGAHTPCAQTDENRG